MSTPSNLTQTGEVLLLALINTQNPNLPNGALTNANVTLGTPTASGTTPNSSLAVNAVAGQGYQGSVTVTYNRLDIQNDVFSVLAPSGATVVNTGGTMAAISDVVAAINASYNLNIVEADVSNWTTALSLTEDAGSCTIDIAAGSLVYTGTLNVAITQQQVALSQAVTNTDLSGLTPPAPSPSPTPTPSPSP